MKDEKKVWTEVDSRNSFLFYKTNVWRTYISNQVSKHGKRNDNESVFV
jgi:hypothetical protein